MLCPNCQHENSGGKFCVKCGTSLAGTEVAAASQTVQSGQQSTQTGTTQQSAQAQQVQPNQQLEAAKKISKQYFSYFLNVLKNPFSQSANVDKNQMVNGIITIILYAFFIPLMVFISLGDLREFIDSPFVNIVILPTIGYAIFILLMSIYSFVGIKLAKGSAPVQDVIARFGAFLVPLVALFVISSVLSLLQVTNFAFILLVFGLLLSIFTIPAFVILSFKSNQSAGFDVFYSVVIAYVLTFITLGIMSEMLFSMVMDVFEGYFNSFFPF